jgi:hypothetical protein
MAAESQESQSQESHIQGVAEKHEKIQELIDAELAQLAWDEVRVAELKKEKLRLKDELERLRTN